VRLANDLIAYSVPTFNPQGPTRGGIFVVRALDGSLVAEAADLGAPPQFDFDGRRLAWITRPCQLGAFVIWDLHGDPPALPSGQCAAPRIGRRSIRIRDRRLHVKLTCPMRPALGCEGYIVARAKSARNRRRHVSIASGDFGFPPGAVRQKALTIDRSAPACARRDGRVRVRITAASYGRRGSHSRTKSSHAVVWLRSSAIRSVACA
jgi:hypothetical protein